MAKTVLIVDDHPSFRASARMLLEAEGFEVVGEAEDGEAGVRAAHELAPEIVLLDIQLPDVDGFEVASRLGQANGSSPAIIMVSSRAREDVAPMLQASSARGFISKSELSGAAVEALLP